MRVNSPNVDRWSLSTVCPPSEGDLRGRKIMMSIRIGHIWTGLSLNAQQVTISLLKDSINEQSPDIRRGHCY